MADNLATLAAAALHALTQAAQAALVILAVVLIAGAMLWTRRAHRAGAARLRAHNARRAARTTPRGRVIEGETAGPVRTRYTDGRTRVDTRRAR